MINSDDSFLIDNGHQVFPVTVGKIEELRQAARYALSALKAIIAPLPKQEPESI